MGHANIYIRKDNEDKWEALADKSAWLNQKLNDEPLRVRTRQEGTPESSVQTRTKPIKTKEDVIPAIKQVFPEAKFEPLYRDKKNKKL